MPDAVLHDHRLSALAFRLLVLLHAETTPEATDEPDLALALACDLPTLDEALRQLEAAGYVVRRFDRDWQVAPWL